MFLGAILDMILVFTIEKQKAVSRVSDHALQLSYYAMKNLLTKLLLIIRGRSKCKDIATYGNPCTLAFSGMVYH